MSAGLAVVAILGGLLSFLIVQPAGLVTTLLTMSVGGSLVTMATAIMADWYRGPRRAEISAGDSPTAPPPDAQPTSL